MTRRRSAIPPLEWAASAIGLALTLGLLGLLAREAFTARSGEPPAIEVRAIAVSPAPHGFVVQFAVRNRSHAVAASVEIEGELETAAGPPETSRALLDYVPGGAERRGGLFFRSDPRSRPFALRALGYQEP